MPSTIPVFSKLPWHCLQARPITTSEQDSEEELIHEFDSAMAGGYEWLTTANVRSDGCEILGQMAVKYWVRCYEILGLMAMKYLDRWLWNAGSDGYEILGQMAVKYWVKWLWSIGSDGYEILG